MTLRSTTTVLIGGALMFCAGMLAMQLWQPGAAPHAAHADATPAPAEDVTVLKLSPQARSNLGLVSRPVRPQTYWRTIEIPGSIEDSPGSSDRSISAPTTGVVTRVYARPGKTVRSGDPLFTLRVSGEYLQTAQSGLFQTQRELQIAREQLQRLSSAAQEGAVPQAKLIDLNNQVRRLTAAEQSHRQDLTIRGLTPQQIAGVAEGRFVSEIELCAPQSLAADADADKQRPPASPADVPAEHAPLFEVQELHAELGQQVQAGDALCMLGNHQSLLIEGRSFRREAPFLEQAAQEGRPIEVEFDEEAGSPWPPFTAEPRIQHLSNTIDPESRTFTFYLPLENQQRTYQQGSETFVLWRFRPGQRVRLHVPVEALENVLVLPAGAVVREGGEAYVFRQNGDLFKRISVRVLHQDRRDVVLANDGSVQPGLYLAQNAAASLNRILKAQAATGTPVNLHVHADGTVHGAH